MFNRITVYAAVTAATMLGGFRIAGAADDKCTIATKGDSPVARACAEGGRTEAKKVMKAAVKAAKEKGGKFVCDDCHKSVDSGNFELKSNAAEDFKKLLALAGGASQPQPGK